MTTINELMNKIYALKKENEAIKEQLDALKNDYYAKESEIETLTASLLEEMHAGNLETFKDNDLVAQVFCKNEFSYGDEKALLKYLKDNNMTSYISTKVTESINKNQLKKDLKVKESLKESLKDYVGDRVSSYVVVTDEENYKKMLEHIEGGK